MTSEGPFLHPNTKITDWLLYPSPVSWSSALPVIPGFCHHWGNPVKKNPNQLELDQVEAESSNKTQHGCPPGNPGLCISTHLLCPTLAHKTDLPVTVTSPCSLQKPSQHCHPTTCELFLSKAVQHITFSPSLFTWKEQALFEEVSVNSVWLCTVLFPKGSNAQVWDTLSHARASCANQHVPLSLLSSFPSPGAEILLLHWSF